MLTSSLGTMAGKEISVDLLIQFLADPTTSFSPLPPSIPYHVAFCIWCF